MASETSRVCFSRGSLALAQDSHRVRADIGAVLLGFLHDCRIAAIASNFSLGQFLTLARRSTSRLLDRGWPAVPPPAPVHAHGKQNHSVVLGPPHSHPHSPPGNHRHACAVSWNYTRPHLYSAELKIKTCGLWSRE